MHFNSFKTFLFLIILLFFTLIFCKEKKYPQPVKIDSKRKILSVIQKYKNDTAFIVHLAKTAHQFKNDSLALFILNYAFDHFGQKKLSYGGSLFLENAASLFYEIIKDTTQLRDINLKLEKAAHKFKKVNIWEEGRAFMLLARAAADAKYFKTAYKFASKMKISDRNQTYGYIAQAAARKGQIDFAIHLSHKVFPELFKIKTLVVILKELTKKNDIRKDSILTQIKKIYQKDTLRYAQDMCVAYAYINQDSKAVNLINKCDYDRSHFLIFSYISAKYDQHDFPTVLKLYQTYSTEMMESENWKIEGYIALLYIDQKNVEKAKKYLLFGGDDYVKYMAAKKLLENGDFSNAFSVLDLIKNREHYNNFCLTMIVSLLNKNKIGQANLAYNKLNNNFHKALAKMFISNWYDRHQQFKKAYDGYQEAIHFKIKENKEFGNRLNDGFILMINCADNPWKGNLSEDIEKSLM